MVYTISGIRFPAVPALCKCSDSTFNGDRRMPLSLFMRKDSSARKIFLAKSTYDSDSVLSTATAASDKVLVPGSGSDGSSTLAGQSETSGAVSEDPQVLHDVDTKTIKADEKTKEETDHDLQSLSVDNTDGDQAPLEEIAIPSKNNKAETTVRSIPPPGSGQRIYDIDPYLLSHRGHLDYRYEQYRRMREAIDQNEGGLEAFSRGYEKFGFTRRK